MRGLIGGLLYSFGCGVEAGGHVAKGCGEGGGFFGFECGGATVYFIAMEALCEPL